MPEAPPTQLSLSIVIPAYNEAERILPTLDRVLEWLDQEGRSAEVLDLPRM